MKTKLRKLLALLMTLAMFISSVPTTALAAVVPYPGGTETGSGISLRSIVKPPVATTTYVFMNGTEEFARQILKDGQTLNNPGTPDAGSPNKEFTGWRDGDNNAPVFGAVTVTETKTITYHAQFADVYFVFFTNPNGEVMVTKKGANGETIPAEGVTYPVGNEESITAWLDASGNLVSSVKLNGRDVTLTAKVENGHWITYDSQGGTYVAPAFVKGNGTTTAPAAPTRPGYTFRHWSATVGGAAFTFGQPLDQALTLYAVWTANTNTRYTVIHWQENADDDEYSYAESETKYGATGAQTSAAAKSYPGFTAQDITQETIAGDGSTIVNVYYLRNVYKVNFNEKHKHTYDRRTGNFFSGYTYYGGCYPQNGGSSTICGLSTDSWVATQTITAKYGANISTQWPVGTFWYVTQDDQTTAQSNLDTMPLGGKEFYGKAEGSGTANYYVQVLPGESGTENAGGKTYKLDHTDTGYTSGTVTDEERYEMTGFTCNLQHSAKNGASYPGAKFYYDRNSYNVVYINNGVTVKTTSYYYEQSISDAGSYTPARPSTLPDTFTFGGWYADPAGGQAYTFNGKTMPAQNVTVYAKWNEPTVNGTAHIKIDGTDAGTTLEGVKYGGTITEQLNALQETIMQDKDGYTWRGWRTGPNGTGEPFNVDTKIYSDITLYPYYTKDGTFTVEYVSGKNNVTAPVDGKSYAEDSFADLMSPGKLVADDGEYFLGWTDGAATYQPRDKYQIKSNHADERNVITLTAQWGARPAGTTLTYKANGGAGADVVENLANNATVTTRPGTTFSRVGYTFKGWDTNPKGEGSIAPNTQVQVDNNGGENVLYAIWTANTDTKYTVEFYYQNVGGTYTLNHSDERTATTDTEVSVTDADKAAKENNKYVFEADNKNNVLSGVVAGDGSLVLKLYFKLNTASYTIHHYLNGTTVKVADDQTGAKTIGETLTAKKSDALYPAYAAAEVASYAPSQTITIAADESENVITVYYTMPLTITAGNAEKTYDGQPLTQPDFTMKGLVNGDTKENFSLSMTAASTITNAGSTPNVIDTDTVKYNGGAIPFYYNVSYAPGTLTVNKASATVTITGVNKTHVYDGTEHEANGYNYSFTGKPNEITISLKPNVLAIARRTDVGTTYMGLTKDSFTVTSANYDVTIKAVIDGYVTITPVTDKVTVTVTENGAIVTYDGNEHSVKGYKSMTADNALYDVTKSVKATETAAWTAKGTNVGEYPVGIAAGDFENTNKNFTNVTFKIVDGVLKINPVTDEVIVTVTENGATVTYDGNEHSVKGYKSMTADNELYDVATSVKATETAAWTAKGTNAGEYPVGIAAGDFENTNKNFTNVTFNIVDGVLKINPITENTITITANSASKTYDGTPLTDNGFTFTQGVLADGDELTAVVEGSATNVGDEGRNVVKSYVVKRGETDVTKNYTFGNSIDGKLTINKRSVTLKSETASKEYDGTPLTKPDVTVTGDGFVTGEVTDVKATGSVTFVHEGEVTNAITYTEGANFKETNYTISKEEGKLSITKREGEGKTITVTANSDEKVYDGAPLTNNGFTHAGALVEGDVLTAVVEGSQTDVGSSDNVVTSYVVMRGETDVTTSYTFGKSMIGTLTVTPVAIELTAASASKAYDGTPLTNSDYTITNGAFVGGEGLATVTIAGSQTLVGTSANTITGHTLKDNTLAQNYTITYQPGELKVTQNEKAITITANSHTWEYDGQPHSDGGYTVNYDGVDYKVEAGKTATLPTGDVVKAKITKTVTNVSDSAANNNQIDELTIVNAAGEDTKGQYKTVTLIPGTLTITKRGAGEDKVKITAADNTVEYDGRPHGAKLNAAGQIEVGTSYTVTNLAEGHSVKTLAIEGSETDAGVYADKLVPGNAVIVDGNGVEVTANYDITYVPGALTITRRGAGDMKVELTAANNTVVYDGQPHGAKLNAAGEIEVGTSYTITNLADGHKVQSVVISGSETAVGEYENRLVPSGAKIVDAEGNDVTRNYVVGYKNGKLTITSPDTVIVTIRGNKDAVEYDGQKHEVNGYEVVSISNTLYTEADFGFADGATAHAEGTDVGDYFMNLTKDSFVNRNGNFSAVTFVVEDGKLTITKRGLDEKNLVKIIAADNTVYYDGQPHGAKLNAAGQIEVGTSYTTEYLAPGHKVQTVAIDGSETMVGVYENKLVPKTAIIVDENDNDVTTNYVITYVPGTLEITQNEKTITITANSHTWEYDGQPHSDGGYTVNYDGVDYPVAAGEFATLPTGDKVTATVEGSVTNVADSADDNNVVTNVTITNEAGTVVNDQYKTITRVNGGLKITRRGDSEDEDKKVRIIAEPNTVEYDGKAHGAKLNAKGEIELGTSYTTARLVDGHYVDETTLDITGSQTNVGVYAEELKPAVKAGATRIVIRDKDGNDVTDNYALTLVNATLTITGDKLIPDKKAEDENIESNYKLGDEIEFTITVKNVSIYDVENVIVTDANAEIQAGDGYTVSADKHTATIAIIAAKSEIRIKALHTVTSEDILAGKVGNVANVEWKDGETTVTKTVDDDTTKLTPPNVTLNVTKTSDWEGKADGAKLELGTKITYTITVKNTGNVPYTNVNFTDLLQNGDATVTGEIPTYGTLAVNEEKSFTVEYIVTEADLLKESINNKVTAEADEIEYTYYEGETEKTGKATPKGEAQVGDRTDDAKASTISTKTTTSTPANGKGYELGETITYEIKVTNDGNLTLTDVEVTEKLAGAVIKASSDYTVSGSVATIAELKPGQTVIVNVEYVVTEADILAGSVKNVATVKGNGPDDKDPDPKDPGTDDPTDKPKATLDIAKSVVSTPKNGTSYKLGEKITYTLTVKVGADNNVTVKDVRVTDTLLTAENVNAKIVEIAGGYTLNATGEIELPDMAPGAADVVITYTYTVQESDLGSGAYGSVHNAAVSKGATPDPDPENPNPKPVDPKDEDKKDIPTNIRLVITANNNTGIVYDGEEHGEDGYKQTGLSKDHMIEKVTISGKRTNVGEEKLVPSDAKIVDKAGNDVTSHYDIEYVNATLEIIQKKLTITADSDEKFYDETPLTKDSYTNTELAKGDKIANVTITGTITEVGSVENVASGAKIVNAAEEDVTGNYDIEYVKGTLTIKAIPADGFVDVTITKKWDDANNQDGKRDDVTLTLNASANGRLIDWDVLKDIAKNGANLTMDETAEHVFARAEFTDDKDSYSYTFRNVPKYANFNDVNTLIDFAVTENEVPDFYEIDVESSTRLMIVNVHEVKTMNIHVTKVWDDEDNNDGYRPDAITVKLYADGALYGEKTITPDENDVWETTFENLPVYKKGETISYTVEEDAIDEYTTTYSTEKPIVGGDYDEAVREVTITNRYEIKKMNIKVIKIWADSDNEDKLRPNALSFDLYKTVGGGERELVLQFQLRSSTGTSVWKYKDLRTTIGGLNVYENGEKIHYSIEETTVIEGYTVKYIDNDIVGGNKVNDQYQTDFMTWVTNYHIIKRPNRLIGPMGMTSGECVE